MKQAVCCSPSPTHTPSHVHTLSHQATVKCRRRWPLPKKYSLVWFFFYSFCCLWFWYYASIDSRVARWLRGHIDALRIQQELKTKLEKTSPGWNVLAFGTRHCALSCAVCVFAFQSSWQRDHQASSTVCERNRTSKHWSFHSQCVATCARLESTNCNGQLWKRVLHLFLAHAVRYLTWLCAQSKRGVYSLTLTHHTQTQSIADSLCSMCLLLCVQ